MEPDPGGPRMGSASHTIPAWDRDKLAPRVPSPGPLPADRQSPWVPTPKAELPCTVLPTFQTTTARLSVDLGICVSMG